MFMKYLFFIFSSIILIQCNSAMTKPTIEAIDPEFNQKAQYSLQYFEISDYEKIPVDTLISDISSFAEENKQKLNKNEDLTMFFYRKKLLNNYKDKVYEAATENEFGGIIGHEKDLVAKVWYKADLKPETKSIFIYKDNKLVKKAELQK